MPLAQTLWHVKHKQHDGTLIADIRPENLQFQLNREPPHTIQYDMSLSRPEVFHDFIGPYRTDFELWYGDIGIMAGPHTGGPQVSLGDDHCTIYGKDWYHLLERRQFPFDPRTTPSFPGHLYDYAIGSPPQGLVYEVVNTDVAQIISDVLGATLSRPHSVGITYPTLVTHLGIPTNFSLAPADTTTMASIIQQMSEIDPGFVYEVLFDKELRLYSPAKYAAGAITDPSDANYVFDNSNLDAIEELSFMNNGPAATHIFGQGPGIGQSTYGWALGAPAVQTVYRRLDADLSLADTTNRQQVQLRTSRAFSKMLNPQHEVTLRVDPAKINDFWILIQPGYALWLNVDLIAHQLDSLQEIVNMTCSVNNEGDASVDFGLEQVYVGTAGIPEG